MRLWPQLRMPGISYRLRNARIVESLRRITARLELSISWAAVMDFRRPSADIRLIFYGGRADILETA